MTHLLILALLHALTADAVPVELGDWCPMDGVLLPTEQAASIAAGYEACREQVVVYAAHLAETEELYQAALVALDASATEAIEDCSAPPWWTSGWTWAAVGAGVVSGLVGGILIGGM